MPEDSPTRLKELKLKSSFLGGHIDFDDLELCLVRNAKQRALNWKASITSHDTTEALAAPRRRSCGHTANKNGLCRAPNRDCPIGVAEHARLKSEGKPPETKKRKRHLKANAALDEVRNAAAAALDEVRNRADDNDVQAEDSEPECDGRVEPLLVPAGDKPHLAPKMTAAHYEALEMVVSLSEAAASPFCSKQKQPSVKQWLRRYPTDEDNECAFTPRQACRLYRVALSAADGVSCNDGCYDIEGYSALVNNRGAPKSCAEHDLHSEQWNKMMVAQFYIIALRFLLGNEFQLENSTWLSCPAEEVAMHCVVGEGYSQSLDDANIRSDMDDLDDADVEIKALPKYDNDLDFDADNVLERWDPLFAEIEWLDPTSWFTPRDTAEEFGSFLKEVKRKLSECVEIKPRQAARKKQSARLSPISCREEDCEGQTTVNSYCDAHKEKLICKEEGCEEPNRIELCHAAFVGGCSPYCDAHRPLEESLSASEEDSQDLEEQLEEQSEESQFLSAASSGDLEACRALLEKGEINVEAGDGGCQNEKNALHLAAEGGFTTVCELLVKHKASVDSQFREGTALHYAAAGGHLDTSRFLLDSGQC